MKKMNLSASGVLLRARQRGYSEESIRGCIVKDMGDRWIVDIDHPAYPKGPNHPAPTLPPPPPEPHGPGTELKKLLKLVGITAAPGCSCNRRAKIMDEKGCEWCKENIETIVDWLGEEAAKRKLPFVRMGAKWLVRRAINAADSKK